MNKITITAKTEKGTDALQQHMRECAKLPMQVKTMWKLSGYYQSIISEKPYSIELGLKNKFLAVQLKKNDFIEKATDALQQNGAEIDIDYTLEAEWN